MSPPGEAAPPGPLLQAFVAMERISVLMATVGGGLLTLLAIFITADVLGRGYGGFYSGATDEIAGYAMCLAVTWSLAYTLTIDKHVRVDLFLGMFRPALRRALDLLALGLLTVFAAMLAWNSWALAMDSLDINARSPGVLQTPVGIPQCVMALGFTVLACQGLLILLVAVLDPSAHARLRAAESAAAPDQFDV